MTAIGMQAAVSGDSVRLFTRTGLDWTGKFQPIADALAALNLKDVLLDGEAAVAQANGQDGFFGVAEIAWRTASPKACRISCSICWRRARRTCARLPLIERKERLEKLLAKAKAPIRVSPYFEGDGPRRAGGVSATRGLKASSRRRPSSTYQSGRTQFLAQGEVRQRAGVRDHRLSALGERARVRLADAGGSRERQAQVSRQCRHRIQR